MSSSTTQAATGNNSGNGNGNGGRGNGNQNNGNGSNRGSNRNNRRGNNNRSGNNNGNGNGNGGSKPAKKEKTLKGDCDELGENVYIINAYNQAEKFAKTDEALFKYIETKYTKGKLITTAIKTNTVHDLAQYDPVWPRITPTGGTIWDKTDKELNFLEMETMKAALKYKMEVSTKLNEQYGQVYALMWGQCTKSLQEKLKRETDYQTVEQDKDPLALHEMIKTLCQDYQTNRYEQVSIKKSALALYGFKQREGESLNDCTERFRITRDVAVKIWGEGILRPSVLIDSITAARAAAAAATPAVTYTGRTEDQVQDATEAFLYLDGIDDERSPGLRRDLMNDYTKSQNAGVTTGTPYPRTLESAVDYVRDWIKENKSSNAGKNKKKKNDSNNGSNRGGNSSGNNFAKPVPRWT